MPDPLYVLAGAVLVLAVSWSALAWRWRPSRAAPAVPVAPPAEASADERALRDFIARFQALEQRVADLGIDVARRPTVAELEEHIATATTARFTALRAEVQAIAEGVDSNLEAVDRTRRRVAARRSEMDAPPQQQAPNLSPAAAAYLRGVA